MKQNTPVRKSKSGAFALGLAMVVLISLALPSFCDDSKTDSKAGKVARAADPKTPDSKAAKAAPAEKPKRAAKEISGPELYSMHCMRCHPERYPNERTSAQWKTILMHMRVRANLPAEQARKVLKYLQDNSGY